MFALTAQNLLCLQISEWEKEASKIRPSLLKVVIRVFYKQFIALASLVFIEVAETVQALI
jgi:hypothetical protein